MKKNALVTAAALAVLVAGCDSTTAPDSSLTPTELAELSDAMIQEGLAESADTSLTATADDGLALDVVTRSTEFARSYACPFGGEISVDGTMERTRETESRAGTMHFEAERTFDGCVRPMGENTVTITLDGAVTFTAHREWQAGQWHGSQEITLVGDIAWVTSDEREGTCAIDLEAIFEPGTGSRTVTGTICGQDLGEMSGWSFGVMGQGPGYQHHYHHGQGGPGGMGGS